MSLRSEVWKILNDSDDIRYRWFHYFINTLILASVGILIWEAYSPPSEDVHQILVWSDHFILGVFLIEFMGRLWVIRETYPKSINLTRFQKVKYYVVARLKFIFSPWGFIDFLAILPIFPFLRSLRILRLLRLLRSVQFFKYARPVETLLGAFRDNAILFMVASGLVIGAVFLSAFMLYLAEYRINPGISSLWDTLWWSIVTISTVGFGDITPQTPGGRTIGAMLMFTGMFVIALFAGVISSTLVGQLLPLQQEQVRMSTIADHIVVAGWNDEVPMMLNELEREFEGTGEFPKVILFAPRERPSNLSSKYIYVQGDFTREEEYAKVRLEYARTAVIVADESLAGGKPGIKDGTTVLAVFTIRSYLKRHEDKRAKPLHIVAEILDAENYDHAMVAGVDEVIETTRVGSSMLAHTASNPGVGSIISSIVFATRENLYHSHLPGDFITGESLSFRDVQQRAQEELGVLVIGIEHAGSLRLNPPPSSSVFIADKIVYLSERPID